MANTKAPAKSKAPIKKSAKRVQPIKKDIVEKKPVAKSISKNSISIKRNLIILGVLVVAIIGVLGYQNKGLLVAATVNGKPISRLAVVSTLEKQGGKTALDSLITETLIMDEAQKQGKSVSQEEIDKEIKRIEDSVKELGQPLDKLLELQGMTKAQLIQQIRIQKLIEKLLDDQVRVNDDEVQKALDEALKSETSPITSSEEAQLKLDIASNLKQQKVSETFPKWLEDLKSRSSIKYFVNY